jgi:hypothetical protein
MATPVREFAASVIETCLEMAFAPVPVFILAAKATGDKRT